MIPSKKVTLAASTEGVLSIAKQEAATVVDWFTNPFYSDQVLTGGAKYGSTAVQVGGGMLFGSYRASGDALAAFRMK